MSFCPAGSLVHSPSRLPTCESHAETPKDTEGLLWECLFKATPQNGGFPLVPFKKPPTTGGSSLRTSHVASCEAPQGVREPLVTPRENRGRACGGRVFLLACWSAREGVGASMCLSCFSSSCWFKRESITTGSIFIFSQGSKAKGGE